MAEGQRSPFGQLVHTYRTRLALTQAELAYQASRPDAPQPEQATVSTRTISNIERAFGPGDAWNQPRLPTVRALATVFGLQPGSSEYDAFVHASKQRPGRLARDAAEEPAGGQWRTAPPFIPAGRESHLERVRAAVRDVIQGVPGMVFIGANPGVGKTTLIAHACHEALAASPELIVLWGDCMGRYGAADPHQPFRQALEVAAGNLTAAGPLQVLSADNAARIAARAGIAAAAIARDADGLVDRLIPAETLRELASSNRLDPATAHALTDALAAPAGSHGNALGINEQFYRVLTAYAAAGPVILVLEDLHWADIGTASMLFHLMRRLRDQDAPILVLGSYRPSHLAPVRPGDRPPFPQIVREAPRHFPDSVIDLSTAVGGEAGRAFVNAMLDETMAGATDAFRGELFTQTAGLPLFVVAMLRWFRAQAPTDRHSDGTGAWPEPRRLPTEIDALFADLIGRLPADLQALLNAASVQGATFSAEILMQVQALSRPVLIEMLDAQLFRRFGAVREGRLATVAGRRSHEYQFAHALLRDYLYHRMTDLERAHYHALTAEAMVALYGNDEHDGARHIASQFDQAGDRRNAARAYLRAGDHAMSFQDYKTARDFFRRIGELDLRAEDPFCVAQAMVGLGNCARGLGRHAEAVRLFNRAHTLAVREGLRLVEANSLTSLGMLDFDAGRMSDGSRRLGEAIDVLIDQHELTEASRALTLLSHTLHGSGQYDAAIARARHAIALANDLGNDMLIVGGMIALANCWLDLGLYQDAIATHEQGLAISEEYGNIHRAAICSINIALCEIEQGAWQPATAALEPVFEVRNRINGRLVGAAEFNAGLIAEGMGDLVDAERRFQASLDLRIDLEQDALIIDSLAGLLEVATAQDNRDRIRALAADIANRMAAQGVEGVEHYGRLFVSLAEAWQVLGDHACARQYAAQGIAFLADRANDLADPAHRVSYLTAPPSHRRLFALAEALGVSGV